jgi:hypothetical protein
MRTMSLQGDHTDADQSRRPVDRLPGMASCFTGTSWELPEGKRIEISKRHVNEIACHTLSKEKLT